MIWCDVLINCIVDFLIGNIFFVKVGVVVLECVMVMLWYVKCVLEVFYVCFLECFFIFDIVEEMGVLECVFYEGF